MIENIINNFFPTSCAICGKIYKKTVCPKCFVKLKKFLNFYTINEEKYKLYFISFYEGILKQLLLKYKFKEKSYLNEFFADLILKNEKLKNIIIQYDFITYVPMYQKNKLIRGYNQSELIAKNISKKLKVPTINCLLKIKENKKQSSLSEKERRENVQDVYKINKEYLLKDKKILLIDDIYTTGSTARECVKQMLKEKPKNVDVLTISKSKKGKKAWKI